MKNQDSYKLNQNDSFNNVSYDTHRSIIKNDKDNLKKRLIDIKNNFDNLISDVQNDVSKIKKKEISGIEVINNTIMSCLETKSSLCEEIIKEYEIKIGKLNEEIKNLYKINTEIKLELRETYQKNTETKVFLDEIKHENKILKNENYSLKKEVKKLLKQLDNNNENELVSNFNMSETVERFNENKNKFKNEKIVFNKYNEFDKCSSDNMETENSYIQEKSFNNISNKNDSNNFRFSENFVYSKEKQITNQSKKEGNKTNKMNRNIVKSEPITEYNTNQNDLNCDSKIKLVNDKELDLENKYLKEKNKDLLAIAKDLENENINLNNIVQMQQKKIFCFENNIIINEL